MGVGGTYLLGLGFSAPRLGDWPGGGAGPPGAPCTDLGLVWGQQDTRPDCIHCFTFLLKPVAFQVELLRDQRKKIPHPAPGITTLNTQRGE